MNKNDIISELMKNDSSVLSFPSRGPWGDNKYRGNCSGYIQAFLIWKYKIKKFAELFAGSGTGYDVARDFGIDYVGADINPMPVRPGILSVNALMDDVPCEFIDADMIFMHPPYSSLINIPYVNYQFNDPTGTLDKYDLGQMPWPEFIKSLNEIVMKYYSAMENGSRMSILMGDVRRQGVYKSMLTDIVKPGALEQILIKKQYNCVSDSRTYANKNFVPILHEYVMVIKKLYPYMINFQLPRNYESDIRDAQKGCTWRDIVVAVLRKIGRPASLSEIYTEIESHKRCEVNPHWREKIRQTLQLYPVFNHVSEGIWEMAC